MPEVGDFYVLRMQTGSPESYLGSWKLRNFAHMLLGSCAGRCGRPLRWLAWSSSLPMLYSASLRSTLASENPNQAELDPHIFYLLRVRVHAYMREEIITSNQVNLSM